MQCTTYLIAKARPKPIAHVSAPSFINDQSPKLILKLLRRDILRIERTTRVLGGRGCRPRSSRRRSHGGRRSWRERKGRSRLSWRDTRCCRPGILAVFPAQVFDDALEASQAGKQLSIGRTLRFAWGPAWWGKHAVDTGLDTIGARRALVTADLPATTSHTAPRTGDIRGRARGGGGHARARTVRRMLTGGGGVQPLRRGRVE